MLILLLVNKDIQNELSVYEKMIYSKENPSAGFHSSAGANLQVEKRKIFV